RVPEEFHPAIAANEAQMAEWERLYAISEIEDAKARVDGAPATGFLRANPGLVVDTAHFDAEFKARLLDRLEDLDARLDGVLIHSDNFQALNLVQTRLGQRAKCIYIDPPYNTDASAIPYKNNYRHSSWCTLIRDRVELARRLMKEDGAIFV